MPSIKKARVEEIKREAEIASEKQMNDIYAAISGLGSNTTSQSRKSEPETPAPEIKTVTKPAAAEVAPVVTTSEPESKDDKPGYVSLVIPNSLKKKWKMYLDYIKEKLYLHIMMTILIHQIIRNLWIY